MKAYLLLQTDFGTPVRIEDSGKGYDIIRIKGNPELWQVTDAAEKVAAKEKTATEQLGTPCRAVPVTVIDQDETPSSRALWYVIEKLRAEVGDARAEEVSKLLIRLDTCAWHTERKNG